MAKVQADAELASSLVEEIRDARNDFYSDTSGQQPPASESMNASVT